MTVNEFRKKVTGLVERNAKVGMKLTLGEKVHTCIGTSESSWGLRYVFDSGLEFTVGNIVANIVKCACEGKNWNFEFK